MKTNFLEKLLKDPGFWPFLAHFAHNLAEINFPDRFYNYLPLSEKTQEKSNEQLENGNFIRPSVYGNPKWGSGTNLENKISSYETDWSMNIYEKHVQEKQKITLHTCWIAGTTHPSIN